MNPTTNPFGISMINITCDKQSMSQTKTIQGKIKVLFICTHNSARSQMAEGILRYFYSDKYEVYSAGTRAANVHPFAVEVMKEIGIDISNHSSKNLDRFLGMELDHVITVCDNANESCPLFPGGKNRMHRSFRDPVRIEGGKSDVHVEYDEEKALEVFRQVRDEIYNWVEKKFNDLHHAFMR